MDELSPSRIVLGSCRSWRRALELERALNEELLKVGFPGVATALRTLSASGRLKYVVELRYYPSLNGFTKEALDEALSLYRRLVRTASRQRVRHEVGRG